MCLLPFIDALYAAYVCVMWPPDDGYNMQSKHIEAKNTVSKIIITTVLSRLV